ncbi:hypothetical protein C8R47DRAFT_1069643 [Mycena vitilis]|nr:hypothetical protein C8R47DRAFT_1069643 [Mycena vitilis]
MAEVLASLQPTEVIPGDDKLDPSGRILSLYGISSGEPLHFLLVGKLLAIQELDDGLRVLVLGPPAAGCPVTRGMFTDQHRVLDSLMQRDSSDIPRVWRQGDPISDTAIIYVRVTSHTTLVLGTPRPQARCAPSRMAGPDAGGRYRRAYGGAWTPVGAMCSDGQAEVKVAGRGPMARRLAR